ncbi:serine hydrolase domain-containing protein [Rhodovibrionaceae bacterium A322]
MTSTDKKHSHAPHPGQTVSLDNWDRAPWNRWSFQNVRQVLPTVEVWRGAGPVRDLPKNSQDLGPLTFQDDSGQTCSIDRWLEDSYSDGFIVLHQGQILFEQYFNGMTPRSLHLSQSVAKSLVGTLAGILIGRGALDPDQLATHYLPELAETAWADAKLRHVLDMTSGVRFIEDYLSPDSDIAQTDFAAGWKARPQDRPSPACIWDQMLGLKSTDREHGALFQYRSIETDCLAHCLERVSGLPLAELMSREIWSKLGVEESACFTVDPAGYALADGGFNASLRDYARFGQMIVDGGRVAGQSLVPADWIEDCWAGADPQLFQGPYRESLPQGAYRNQFWIPKAGKAVLQARGVFGQFIYMDLDRQLVAVKLSSWPEFQSNPRNRDALSALEAITQFVS